MSNKSDSTILLPGSDGWELWRGSPERGFSRTLESGPMQPSGIEKIQPGRLIMAFPVREALAVPLKVQTTDKAMFEDLAAMHLEKSGVRVEQEAGRLTDVFSAGGDDEHTSLLSVVLSAPREGTMPHRSPHDFDLSARMLPMAADAVIIWRELGRWVFAVASGGKLQYFQALSGMTLGEDTGREIKLALTQLALQGVDYMLERAVVWTSGTGSDPSDDVILQLGENLGVEISAEPKPDPVLPSRLSRLVPADVRAEQRLRAERQKRNLLIAAVLLVYLGLAGYFAYQYFTLRKELKQEQSKLAQIDQEYKQIEFFVSDWNELGAVVDSRHWPLTLLKRTSEAIPPGQVQNLRFTVYQSSIGSDGNGNEVNSITIRGEANTLPLSNDFLEKLKKQLPEYEWKKAPAQKNSKTNRWKFSYDGILVGEEMTS